jgi:catechol 2,3-dioxygenase-like lactoylglutathione lyase family enzyme
MKMLIRYALVSAVVVMASTGMRARAQQRPAITGISHMCVYASDMAATENFYMHILGATKGSDPLDAKGVRYAFSPTQYVEVLPLPNEHSLSRQSCVAFSTADAPGLRSYLQAHGIAGAGDMQRASDGSRWFAVNDPEGNRVEFVQGGQSEVKTVPISTRIIHVGYMVKSKEAEDKFYREVLGFRPYWYGGSQPGKVDWISLQVPDGHDWVEYMMVGEGSDTPIDKVDARSLGVMNHFSLGVPNMEAAVTTLYREDRLSPRHDGPQMGHDGKWQANFYDPDGTRVELMEFQPVMKSCCSVPTAEAPTK